MTRIAQASTDPRRDIQYALNYATAVAGGDTRLKASEAHAAAEIARGVALALDPDSTAAFDAGKAADLLDQLAYDIPRGTARADATMAAKYLNDAAKRIA